MKYMGIYNIPGAYGVQIQVSSCEDGKIHTKCNQVKDGVYPEETMPLAEFEERYCRLENLLGAVKPDRQVREQ